MRIIIIANATYCLQALSRVVNEIPDALSPSATLLSFHHYYGDRAGQCFDAFDGPKYALPRSKDLKDSAWKCDHAAEIRDSIESVISYLNNVFCETNPALLLMADGTGILESLAIQTAHKRRVPILIAEHGMGGMDGLREAYALTHSVPPRSNTHHEQRPLREFVARLRRMVRGYLHLLSTRTPAPCVPSTIHPALKKQINLPSWPETKRRISKLCCLNEVSKRAHLMAGLSEGQLTSTGFPGFDRFLPSLGLEQVQSDRTRKPQILFVSTGQSMFSQLKTANRFQELVLDCYHTFADRFEIAVRPKLGEVLAEIPSEIKLNDPQVPFLQQAREASAIISDGSMAMMEALEIGKPCAVIHTTLNDFPHYYRSIIFESGFGLLAIDGASSLPDWSCLDQLFEEDYLPTVYQNIQRNESELFWRLDGMAHVRISQECVALVQR